VLSVLLTVTNALVIKLHSAIKLPCQADADRQKMKFYQKAGFPNVVGCINGTHVKIQAPSVNKHEYINRKNQHSVNVQV